jgi:hypothetical protein
MEKPSMLTVIVVFVLGDGGGTADGCREDCIFATNTSSLSVTEIASSCSQARQERYVYCVSTGERLME